MYGIYYRRQVTSNLHNELWGLQPQKSSKQRPRLCRTESGASSLVDLNSGHVMGPWAANTIVTACLSLTKEIDNESGIPHCTEKWFVVYTKRNQVWQIFAGFVVSRQLDLSFGRQNHCTAISTQQSTWAYREIGIMTISLHVYRLASKSPHSINAANLHLVKISRSNHALIQR